MARLYDPGQLAQNDVPTAAVVYANDMYVDRVLSEATVERVSNLRVWATDEYEHNGLIADAPGKGMKEDSQMSAEVVSPITAYFRVCDAVRVTFADNKADSDITVLLLAPVAKRLGRG